MTKGVAEEKAANTVYLDFNTGFNTVSYKILTDKQLILGLEEKTKVG